MLYFSFFLTFSWDCCIHDSHSSMRKCIFFLRGLSYSTPSFVPIPKLYQKILFSTFLSHPHHKKIRTRRLHWGGGALVIVFTDLQSRSWWKPEPAEVVPQEKQKHELRVIGEPLCLPLAMLNLKATRYLASCHSSCPYRKLNNRFSD